MIEMDETIRAIVFTGFADRADYLAAVNTNPDGNGFRLTSRIRWHTDKPTGDPFRDNDRKQWFRAHVSSSLDEAIAAVRDLALSLCDHAAFAGTLTGDSQVFVLVRGDSTLDEFAAKLQDMPFAYQRQLQ